MRVPAPARPCRALHVALGRRGSTACDQCPGFLQDADGIDPRRRICRVRRCKGRWPFVHRRDVGAQAKPCGDTRDKGAGQSVADAQSRGRAATAANRMRAIPKAHAPGLQPAGHPGCAQRARPPMPHDVQHDGPGRVRATQSHQQSRQSLAFRQLPAGTLVQHQQGEAVEQRQPRRVMAVVAPHGRLQHGRLHGHVSPQPGLTRKTTPRCAPSTAGDGVHSPDHAALAIGGRRAPSARAPRAAGGPAASRSRDPACFVDRGPRPRAASASARAIADAARAPAARRRRRVHAGTPGGWLPGRSADRPALAAAARTPRTTHSRSQNRSRRRARARDATAATVAPPSPATPPAPRHRALGARSTRVRRLPNRATCRRRARQSASP